MKRLLFEPINESLQVVTDSNILDALLSKELNVLTACGGKGLCATCHVHVEAGVKQLSPRTSREERTLSCVTGCDSNSRLACQARVLGEGVVVRLPEGMFIESGDDLLSFLGKRAQTHVLHPIDGSILIEKGKIITRSRIRELESLSGQVKQLRDSIEG